MDQNQNKNLIMQLEAALSVFNASEVFNSLSRAKDSLNKNYIINDYSLYVQKIIKIRDDIENNAKRLNELKDELKLKNNWLKR